VAGAGIVGLAFALALSEGGSSIAVIAPDAKSKTVNAAATEPLETRVYALSPATRRFLEDLRIWHQLDAGRIGVATDMRVFGRDGTWSELHFGAYQSGAQALAFMVGHNALVGALKSALGFQKNVRFVRGAVTGLEVSTDGVVVHGDGFGLKAKLAVGADGIDSAVREAAGITSKEKSLGATGFVANFASELPHHDCAYQWFSDEGIIALLPLPGRRVSLVWSAPEALAADLANSSPVEFASRLAPYAGKALGTLSPVSEVSSFALRRLSVGHWVKPGVALVGDAAHVIHPLAGQGLNLGLDDARVLAEILSARGPQRSLGELRLLRSFERRRKEAVMTMGTATDALNLLFGRPSGMLAPLAGLGMAALNRMPPLKNQLIGHALQNAAFGF